MERAVTDTQPLPVVETASPPTVALPVEPPPPPPAAAAPRVAWDRTPLVLGLLAVAAVLAIGLSVLALARRNPPASPTDPAGAVTPSSSPAASGPDPAVPTTAPTVTAPPSTSGTVAPATTASSPGAVGGQGKGGGKGKG